MRKSWTACGYKSEKNLTCSNEGTMVMFTDDQVGTTNLILKKVILPGMGMETTTGTSLEKIGLICDEFRVHSAAVVKEYCTLLPFSPLNLFLAVSPLLLNLLIKLLTRFSGATSKIYMIFTSSQRQLEIPEILKRPQDSC